MLELINMAEALIPGVSGLRFDSKPCVISPVAYQDIIETSRLLANLKPKDLQLHPDMSTVPLFSGTSLEAESGESSIATLCKNVYFISRLCKNFEDLLKNFVNRGILTVDDREKIKLEQGSLQRTVLMFSIVVTKNELNFPIFIDVLHNTDNEVVAAILLDKFDKIIDVENMNARKEDIPEAAADIPDIDSVRETEDNSASKWACKFCTFLNSGLAEQCVICNNPFSIKCQMCTLINTNQPELQLCTACEAPLPGFSDTE